MFAVDLEQSHECSVDRLEKTDKRWPNYLMGIVDQLNKSGAVITGFDCVFGGDIPIGAGMSSSAAIEAGLAFALNEVFELNIDRLDLVKLAQRAENEFVGVQCGVMDQFINLYGLEDNVLKLDCRSLEYEYYPFVRNDLRVVLCDTHLRRFLATSEYNERRSQCEAAVQIMRAHFPEVKSMRDLNQEMIDYHRDELGPLLHKRSTYVISENERVVCACDDLKRAAFETFGRRMHESHRGLRDQYEVSCGELDVLVEIALTIPGVLGARMMGAGFGGCTINLVEEKRVEEFAGLIQTEYSRKWGKDISVHQCRIGAGTARVVLDEVSAQLTSEKGGD
jgi:galactokinase